MVICLERSADLHTAHLMPVPLTVSCSSKSRLVLPFWYRLTRIVPDKGPLNGCVCVCVCVCVAVSTVGCWWSTRRLAELFRRTRCARSSCCATCLRWTSSSSPANASSASSSSTTSSKRFSRYILYERLRSVGEFPAMGINYFRRPTF